MNKLFFLLILLMADIAHAQQMSSNTSGKEILGDSVYQNAWNRINDLTIPYRGLSGWWNMNKNFSNKVNIKSRIQFSISSEKYDNDRFLTSNAALSSGRIYDCIGCKSIDFSKPKTIAFWFTGNALSIKYSIPDTILIELKIKNQQLTFSRLNIRDKEAKSGLGKVASSIFNSKELSYEYFCESIENSDNYSNNRWKFIVLYVDSSLLGISINGKPIKQKEAKYYSHKELIKLLENTNIANAENENNKKVYTCSIDISLFDNKIKKIISDTIPFDINIQDGQLDDLLIYEREINPGEIYNLYRNEYSDETINIITQLTKKHELSYNTCLNSDELLVKYKYLQYNYLSIIKFIEVISGVKGDKSKAIVLKLKEEESIRRRNLVHNIANKIVEMVQKNQYESLSDIWALYSNNENSFFTDNERNQIENEFRSRIYTKVFDDLKKNINSTEYQVYINSLNRSFRGLFETSKPIDEILEKYSKKEGLISVYYNYLSSTNKKYEAVSFEYQGKNIYPLKSVYRQNIHFENNELSGLQESISFDGYTYQVRISKRNPIKEVVFRNGDSIIVRTYTGDNDFYTYEYLSGENITLNNIIKLTEDIVVNFNKDTIKFRDSQSANSRLIEVRSAREKLESLYLNKYPKDTYAMIRLRSEIERADRLISLIESEYNNILAKENNIQENKSKDAKSKLATSSSGKKTISDDEFKALDEKDQFAYLVYMSLPPNDDDIFMKLVKEEVDVDPQEKSGKLCGRKSKKCDWCSRPFTVNTYYRSIIANFGFTLRAAIYDIKMHSIINAQDEKYQENLSDIKRIIKYYKSGNIYYCDEQKNFLTSITTQEQKYCSKKCERDSQLY